MRKYNDIQAPHTAKIETDLAALRDIESPLFDSLNQADAHMVRSEYQLAVKAYETAIDRFAEYDTRLRAAIDNTIGYLSTKGCPASPPHPGARKMIALRNRL